MKSQGDSPDQRQISVRPADELAQVVSGDVLDDLAARVADRPSPSTRVTPSTRSRGLPKRWRKGAGEVRGEASADRRVARGVEREPLAVSRESRCWRAERRDAGLDRAREVARLVLEQGRCMPARVEILAERGSGRPLAPGQPRAARTASARLETLGNARPPSGCIRYGPGISPHRRGVGSTLPGFAARRGRTRARRRVEHLEVALREHGPAWRRPCRADAVLARERAAGVEARGQDRLGERLTRVDHTGCVVESRRVQVAVPCVEDVRRPSGRTPRTSEMRASTSGSLVRGTTPSCT